jgi:hypothetical protein
MQTIMYEEGMRLISRPLYSETPDAHMRDADQTSCVDEEGITHYSEHHLLLAWMDKQCNTRAVAGLGYRELAATFRHEPVLLRLYEGLGFQVRNTDILLFKQKTEKFQTAVRGSTAPPFVSSGAMF